MDSLTPLHALAQAHAAAAASSGGLKSLTPLIIIGLLFGAMYLLVIKPQRRRQQDARKLAATASVGNKVLLAGGFVAEILAVRDDEFDVRLSADSTATVVKAAVLKVIPPDVESIDATDASSNEASA